MTARVFFYLACNLHTALLVLVMLAIRKPKEALVLFGAMCFQLTVTWLRYRLWKQTGR